MNYKFLAKNGLTLGLVLGLIGIAIMIIPVLTGIDSFNEVQATLGDNVNKLSQTKESNIFLYGIYAALGLIVIAFGLAIIFGIFGTLKNVKENKKALIGVGLLAVLFIALNAAANTNLGPEMTQIVNDPRYGIEGNISIYKWISAGITGTLILIAVAFAAMVILEIWNFFKNS